MGVKINMNTHLTMTDPEIMNTSPVEITAAAMISTNEFTAALDDGKLPERLYDRLNKYTGWVTPTGSCTISQYNVMLLVCRDSRHGIAVCGQNGIAYAGFYPDGATRLTQKIDAMADYICALGRVPGGARATGVSMGDLGTVLDMAVTADNGVADLLIGQLQLRDEIDRISMTDDRLDIKFSPDIAQNIADVGNRFMTLRDLIRCNLEDVHLCHADIDHELATVVLLNEDTLTAQGKREWRDVLDAKIERIYTGSYGLQIGLFGVEAERLSDFSFMLAGYVSEKDYDRWVTSDERLTADAQLAIEHFAERMQTINGIDLGKSQEWLDHMWDMSAAYAQENHVNRVTAYPQLIKKFADAFTAVDHHFEDCAAEIFNYQAAYHPDQLYKIADYICNGGSAEDAYEIWGSDGFPEITDPPDEDESAGMVMQ